MKSVESFLHRKAKELLYSEIESKSGFDWKSRSECGFERLSQKERVTMEFISINPTKKNIIIHDIAVLLDGKIVWVIEIINKHYPNWIEQVKLKYPVYIVKADNILKRVDYTPVFIEDIITSGEHKIPLFKKIITHDITGRRKVEEVECSSRRDERSHMEILCELYNRHIGNWKEFEHPLNFYSKILNVSKCDLKELILSNIRKSNLEEMKQIMATDGISSALMWAGKDTKLKEQFIAQLPEVK